MGGVEGILPRRTIGLPPPLRVSGIRYLISIFQDGGGFTRDLDEIWTDK